MKLRLTAPNRIPDNRIPISLYGSLGNQRCSPLLSLPTEIRLRIYEYVFGNGIIHLVRTNSRVAHFRCRSPDGAPCANRWYGCPASARVLPTLPGRPEGSYPHHNENLLACLTSADFEILRTCRQIYAEAIHIPYSQLTFDIDELSTWIFFCRSIPPEHLARVRSLHITLTTLAAVPLETMRPAPSAVHIEFWALVAFAMPALVHLRLCYNYVYVRREFHRLHLDRRWPNWVLPILNIRGLRSCDLIFNEIQHALSRGGDPSPPAVGSKKQMFLEDVRRIICRGTPDDRRDLDVALPLLSRSASQQHKDALRSWLERRRIVVPGPEPPALAAECSLGVLAMEPYRPDEIEAHKECLPWRDPHDGQLYVDGTIIWIIQKVSRNG
jgi:hypothetical protein